MLANAVKAHPGVTFWLAVLWLAFVVVQLPKQLGHPLGENRNAEKL